MMMKLDGIPFVCCKSPSGLLDAMHAGNKRFGSTKTRELVATTFLTYGYCMMLLSEIWSRLQRLETSGSSSNKRTSASAGGALGAAPSAGTGSSLFSLASAFSASTKAANLFLHSSVWSRDVPAHPLQPGVSLNFKNTFDSNIYTTWLRARWCAGCGIATVHRKWYLFKIVHIKF